MMTPSIFSPFLSIALGAVLLSTSISPAIGQQANQTDEDQAARLERCTSLAPPPNSASPLESIQVETGDIGLHERFFEQLLHAQLVFRVDHPLVDHIRAYCYRHVLIVIRQDLKTPRPTGWVQMNFLVPNVEKIQQELDEAQRELSLLESDPSQRPYPVRMKRMVPRNRCRVDRLEVSDPEGFMIGFDQIHKETCRPSFTDNQPPRMENKESMLWRNNHAPNAESILRSV